MIVFKLFSAVRCVPYAEKYVNILVLTNLNDLNEWAIEASVLRSSAGAPVTTEMQNWQASFYKTAQYGGTRQQVRELEQKG